MPTWLAKLVQAVDSEYDRRIRRASNVVSYDPDGTGAAHSASEHHSDDVLDGVLEEEDEGVEIVNVPRGTRIGPAAASFEEE